MNTDVLYVKLMHSSVCVMTIRAITYSIFLKKNCYSNINLYNTNIPVLLLAVYF